MSRKRKRRAKKQDTVNKSKHHLDEMIPPNFIIVIFCICYSILVLLVLGFFVSVVKMLYVMYVCMCCKLFCCLCRI